MLNSSNRLTLGLIINSELYVRNYMEGDALLPLFYEYEIKFIVKSDIALSERVNGFNVIRYDEDGRGKKRRMTLFDIFMNKYKYLSSSFRYRKLRQKKSIFDDFHLGLSLRKNLISLYVTCRRFNNYLFNQCLSILPKKILFLLFGHNYVNKSLEAAILSAKPDLILLPSSAYAPEDIDFSIIGKKLSIKSILLVDNWDNMSSKSILYALPDCVCVWGEQSKEHAIRIQKFSPETVHLIGSVRFDSYFKSRDEKIVSHYPFRYVLFVGTALYFNELEALRSLDAEITNNRNIYGDLMVVYRPHPWRQKKESFPTSFFQSIILDLQIPDNYIDLNINFQPSLNYYPSLLSNAEFIIGGMTSMMIESLIFRKKFLGLVYEEQGSITSPHIVYSNYEHFENIDELNDVTLCHSLNLLPYYFSSLYKNSFVDLNECDAQRNFYLFDNGKTYAERLNQIISSEVQVEKNEID